MRGRTPELLRLHCLPVSWKEPGLGQAALCKFQVRKAGGPVLPGWVTSSRDLGGFFVK